MNSTTARITLLVAIASIAMPVTHAAVDKKQCKTHAASVLRLSRELGVTDQSLASSGRSMLSQIQDWIVAHDDAAIDAMKSEIEVALAGVKECESNGFFAQVTKVKPLSRTLKSAVVPWLNNAAALDPCQETIAKAVEKRESEPDAAITELEGALGECRDRKWIRSARRRLAETLFMRGDIARGDFAAGREQVRLTLDGCAELEPDAQVEVRAVLARTMIEAGKSLMEGGSHAEAALHWESYIEMTGAPGFEPVFASRQASDGAQGLRALRDANYQWALACLELADIDCVTQRLAAAAQGTDMLESLVERTFRLAGEPTAPPRDAYERAAFELLDRWWRQDPDSYQITRLLQSELLELPAPERMQRLRQTDACWIPTRVAEMLQRDGRDFIEEATLAASCTGGGGGASAMLARVEVDRARSLLDRVVLASSADERRAHEAELERVLASIGDTPDTREIRQGLEAERARQRASVVNVRDNSQEIYADCTTILATIQWNESREEDATAELRNFKSGCCTYLRAHRAGWVSHLKSKLGADQVVIKQRLMTDYCGG